MKRTVYVRVSTQSQTYDRQMGDFNKYFDRMGMSWDGVEIVSEKITSHTRFTERAIYPILKKASEGDVVYVCQLDRLGRTMVDILELVDYAVKKGVILLTIDNGYLLENKTAMGKLYLGMVSAMAEAERELRAERCQAGIDAATEEIRCNGYRITKRGTTQTRWGRPADGVDKHGKPYWDLSAANEASCRAKQEAVIHWREQSKGYNWVRTQIAKGKSRSLIIKEFNELHAVDPNNYSTREGKPLSKGVLSKWCREMNPLVV